VTALLCLCPGSAQEQLDEQAKLARGQSLLKQARAALGGEAAFEKLQTLSVGLKVQRFVKYVSVQGPEKVVEKERTLSGKIKLEFLLPDKFRRKFSVETFNSFKITFTEFLNGEKAWRDPPLQVRSANGDNRVVDVGDVERTLNLQTQNAQQQMSFFTLMYLLQTPSSVPTKWRAEGVYRLSDQTLGSEPKDVEVMLGEGPDNFRPIMLFEPSTHLPLGVAVAYAEAVRPTVLVEVGAFDRNYLRRCYQRAAQERRARTGRPRIHEMRWLLSDYRQVNGLLWSYRITITRDGEKLEEMLVTELEVNRPINPKRFEGEPQVKY
jgi:hypothetical protein